MSAVAGLLPAERRRERILAPPVDGLFPAAHASKWKIAALIFGAWTCVGLFRAIERYTLDPTMQNRLEFGFREALAQNLVSCYIWAAFTPLVVWIARRRAIHRAERARLILSHLSASLLFPVAHSLLFTVIYPSAMGVPFRLAVQLRAMPSVLHVLFLTHFLTYWGIVGVAWAIEAYRMSRERELRASQLEAQLADARLEALKMQLHPHFLFNSLNSILPLVFRDRDAAARTVVQLGELLRISLEREATAHILLSQELEFLKLYLELQKTRYQDRLTVSVAVEPDILAAEVPNLILQPLVENAIKHGVGALPGSGHIEVRGFREGGLLILRVSDDGPGIPEGRGPEKSGGVGLRNTRARLEHLYEGRHRFEHANRPEGGLAVTLAIPLSFNRPSERSPSGDRFDTGESGRGPRADARGLAGRDSA